MKQQELERVKTYLQQNKINTQYILLFELYNDIFNINNYFYQVQAYIGETSLDLPTT